MLRWLRNLLYHETERDERQERVARQTEASDGAINRADQAIRRLEEIEARVRLRDREYPR